MLGKRLLLLAALLSAAPLAHAQIGIYTEFTATRLGGLQSSPVRDTSQQYLPSINPTGGTFGAFYDFRTIGPVRLGVDARINHITDTRGALQNAVGAGTHIFSGLGGVRASFHTPVKLLVPYVQASAGVGRSDFGILRDAAGRSAPVNSLEYHVYAGADFNLLPYLTWRVAELGYGGLESSHNYPIYSVATGIVFRFRVPE